MRHDSEKFTKSFSLVLAKMNLSGRIINASLLNFFSIVSTLGISICSECRQQWHPHFYQRVITCGSEEFPVFSSIQYSPIAGKVLLAAKENSQVQADDLILDALTKALCHAKFIKLVSQFMCCTGQRS